MLWSKRIGDIVMVIMNCSESVGTSLMHRVQRVVSLKGLVYVSCVSGNSSVGSPTALDIL